MNSLDVFRTPGCNCDTAATLGAILEGHEPDLCPVHDQDQIAERDQQRQLEERARLEITNDNVAARAQEIHNREATSGQQFPDTAPGLNSTELEQSIAAALGIDHHT